MAQPRVTAESCAQSFPARLADAQNAIVEWREYMAEYNRVMPWFEQHCRLLEPLERVARRVDDEFAFVCDTQRGRPRELTPRFVETHSVATTIPVHQRLSAQSLFCREHDTRERVPLALHDADETMQIVVMCFGAEERPFCTANRERIAARLRELRGEPPEPSE